MAYIIGQYNKSFNSDNDTMTPINGTANRRETGGDSEQQSGGIVFEDECLVFSSALSSSKNYYFHGKIKRMTSSQTFYVKLIYFSPSTQEEYIEQYIKTIDIAGGSSDENNKEWIDIEFIFSPLESFNCLLFELKRNISDYREQIRYPLIAYEEVSEIGNIIGTEKVKSATKLIKLGIQSRPGLLMCINGEEIRTCRTGIYELKNGVMTATFFSVVRGAPESSTAESWQDTINELIYNIDIRQESGEITPAEAEALKKEIHSNSFLNETKTRTIDAFTLDYMFRKDT